MGPTRIIDQYLLYCEEMCSDFEPLGKSSLFTILDACKASTRKSLQGINYFAAEAGEAFDGIRKMIEDKVALHNDSARLIENLKRARFYLKSDYKVHVARSSNIADHCCVYALSDPEKRDFAQDCDHEHNESCAECSNLTRTLNEIERLLEETEEDEELLHRTLKKFRSYREAIEAWKAHLLRSINQDLCRENLLDKLSNDEIYLNLDWAMKFLPIKSREPQSEFFANEILNESQIRSFFGRLKRERQISGVEQTSTDKLSAQKKSVKSYDNENDDQEELEDDFQENEAAIEEIKVFENLWANAKRALESSSHGMDKR
ncbi:unnamed protein product [Rotaria sp. Silwood1]|nr:unnamed protein product [Rotaria sp. Silwood1]